MNAETALSVVMWICGGWFAFLYGSVAVGFLVELVRNELAYRRSRRFLA